MSPSETTDPDSHSARGALAQVVRDFREFASAEPLAPALETAPERGTPGADQADGPLGWPGYDEARARAALRTGESESVVCGTGIAGGAAPEGRAAPGGGTGAAGGVQAVLISFEFGFLGGSLGERTGDRIEAAHLKARELGLPVVTLVATGGSRMQEGMRALSQLQRVARQTALTRRAGLPQLAVVRDPSTGGGWATLAAGADVVLGLPGAQAAFAGSRVRPPDADPAAYTVEGQYAAGHLDQIVPPARLGGAVAEWLALLTGGTRSPEPAPVPYALTGNGGDGALPGSGPEAVARARSSGRPRAAAYLDAYFDTRREISGDRCGGADPGTLCGFGLREGRAVAYVAQCGTATLPSGYRAASRLIRMADRLGLPVLTLIDTPGAANGAEDERAGAGPAIAEVFAAVAEASVPVTSLLIGEGGSGGALALAAPGRLWVTPDSYFSVIAPEPAAAILKRGPERVPETAEALRLRPQDAVALGVARGVAEIEEEAGINDPAAGGE
ncbi:acetyl-CoA carboxylase [Streptomyces sp. NBC_01775]|uniref:carboxyl transferase domain-containing protein n=1 Tax=Streptomyces sp. NBC_01775 TaxID=2975939 RepID=UPI002DDA4757|nr:carboxyl transferase domain-containing protein [Streptomyces sp. NBC_01775]WSB80070.1 acetyl-CoA carboxylase [Streptomyces sp. NBC_01775]